MRTYALTELADFLLFIIDQEQDDTLWELWLAKDIKDDFKTFKNKKKQVIRKKKKKAHILTESQEREILSRAARRIKPKEGGEMNG